MFGATLERFICIYHRGVIFCKIQTDILAGPSPVLTYWMACKVIEFGFRAVGVVGNSVSSLPSRPAVLKFPLPVMIAMKCPIGKADLFKSKMPTSSLKSVERISSHLHSRCTRFLRGISKMAPFAKKSESSAMMASQGYFHGKPVSHFIAKSNSSKSARKPSASSSSAACSSPSFLSSASIQFTLFSNCNNPAMTSLPNQMLNL